jgi:hypothetical protein
VFFEDNVADHPVLDRARGTNEGGQFTAFDVELEKCRAATIENGIQRDSLDHDARR